MKNEELETIILFNRADSKDGYFTVSTSIKSNADKIKKRVGEHNIKDLKIDYSRASNEPIYWQFTLPIQCYSRSSYGIRKCDNRSYLR